jgi:DNA-directed RNA polymerase specialized sigma24 family protein
MNESLKGGKHFPETQRTLLVAAQHSPKALEDFMGRYWLPAFAYIRAILKDEDEAQDLAQEFFKTRVLSGALLRQYKWREGGNGFRPYLKQALRYCVLDYLRAKKASRDPLKLAEHPDGELRGWDIEKYGDRGTPDDEYERGFLRGVLNRALIETERLCQQKGQGLQFEIFSAKFLGPGGDGRSWEDVAREFGLASGGKQARNLAQTVVEGFRRALRHELVVETGAEDAADDELNELLKLN